MLSGYLCTEMSYLIIYEKQNNRIVWYTVADPRGVIKPPSTNAAISYHWEIMPVLEPQEQKMNKIRIQTKNVFTIFLYSRMKIVQFCSIIKNKTFSGNVDPLLNSPQFESWIRACDIFRFMKFKIYEHMYFHKPFQNFWCTYSISSFLIDFHSQSDEKSTSYSLISNWFLVYWKIEYLSKSTYY